MDFRRISFMAAGRRQPDSRLGKFLKAGASATQPYGCVLLSAGDIRVLLYDFNGDTAAVSVRLKVNPLPAPVIAAPAGEVRTGDTTGYSVPLTTGSTDPLDNAQRG